MYSLLTQCQHTQRYRLITPALFLLLTGCSGLNNTQSPPPNTIEPIPVTSELKPVTTSLTPTPKKKSRATLQMANRFLQQGRKLESARAYYQVAQSYPSPQRERIVLQAAEITASLGDQTLTQRYLSEVDSDNLTDDGVERLKYINALLALQLGNKDLALQLLPSDEHVQGSPALYEKIRHIRQKASAPPLPPVQRPVTAAIAPLNTTYTPVTNQPIIPTHTDRIAILLPKKGSLGAAASDIYQGIQIAQAQTGTGTELKFYNTDNGILRQYRLAVADGADLIIGPLDKDGILELLTSPQELTKPILALNYLDNNTRTSGVLYQFGLSPEDEAKQVATSALQRGHTQAVVLVPNSSWGARIATAFTQAYQAGGGSIVATERYADKPSNYLQHVQRGVARKNAQMVFLAASPTQARLMRPLLQAQAGLLPVYATSHIFSGRPDPSKDADLDGIIYTEIPWVLENIKTGSLTKTQYPRLYALGIDAFLVAKNMQPLVQGQTALRGKTGQVSMQNQKVQRTLGLATFINGQPTPLER